MMKFSLTNEGTFKDVCSVIGLIFIVPIWLYLFGRFAYPVIQEYAGTDLANILAYASYICGALAAIFAASACTQVVQVCWINKQQMVEVTLRLDDIRVGEDAKPSWVGVGTRLLNLHFGKGRVWFWIDNPNYKHVNCEMGEVTLREFVLWMERSHRKIEI